ncbi:endolytic transglycosylase MltG [Rhodosalinus halophilus]|uniref:Endolytic murein transglycosylase n=1 Tax=Rhodosalinus halophilus TaxID=2259333 RepID=A0A365UDS7_9RHOB|nr:endolytic transglycosylase MltG [Rhodosalinus halophilus]RBI87689.1 endolytic transglycosylase MltG [Rhodosalinus halophilus]
MWRAIASNALTLIAVVLFLGAGLIVWAEREYRKESALDRTVCVSVPRGGNIRELSRRLEDQGVVSSGLLMRLAADYGGMADDLKAGNFLIEPGASIADVVGKVTGDGISDCGTVVTLRVGVNASRIDVLQFDSGTADMEVVAEIDLPAEEMPEVYRAAVDDPITEYNVIVAEGVTSWQVATSLEGFDVLSGEIAETPAEGTLAPGGYTVRRGDARAELIETMQARQSEILAAAWAARAPGLPLASPEEALILASIIEKETAVPEERGRVASVFVNRLERGMRLQTDPTVIYGITEGQGVLGRGLRQSELRAATPWNTYVIDGLPPTPIANPGRASIEAALDPDATDFLFFVADGSGGHAFAETLAEHNRNVARWREIEAAREAEGAQ